MAARYRAFLSYSHRDSAFAERFHRDLEGWRADRGLVGRATPYGPAPRTLRPIFRDRDDFAGGRTLSEATGDALRQSDFMILLCSPAAAASPYVNEEVRLFKSMGGADRIIPVIVAGEPGGPPGENCFPEALVREVDEAGRLTDAIEERLAADARDAGDGPRRALAKVIAGLLGVPFDEIVRRAERAQRRRQRVVGAVAALMAVLAAAAGGMAWLAEERRVVSERNYEAALDAADALIGDIGEELARIEGVRLETTKRLLGRGAGVYDDLLTSLPDAPELKFRKATALAVFAKAYSAKGDLEASDAALAEAEALMAEVAGRADAPPAAALGLAMVWTRQGASKVALGDRAGAVAKLRKAVEGIRGYDVSAFDDPDVAFEAAHATLFLARLLQEDGDTAGAAAAEATGAGIVAHWRAETPEDLRWLAAEVTHLEVMANAAALAGDAATALAYNRDAAALLVETVAAMPENGAVRALLAEVRRSEATNLTALGDAEGAAAALAERNALLADLAAADRENRTSAVRAAAVSVEQASARLEAGGARAQALTDLRAALGVLQQEVAAAPDNLEARLNLRAAIGQAGWAMVEADLHREAVAYARQNRALAEAALAAAPANRQALIEAVGARALLGAALAGAGERAAAIQARLAQVEGEAVLVRDDPSRRLGLAGAHWEVGFLLWSSSRRAEALTHYRRRAELLDAVAAETADPAARAARFGPQRAFVYLNLGELSAFSGDLAAAAAAFRRSLEIAVASLAARPDDRDRLIDLAWAEARMAQFGDSPAARWPRVERLLEAADVAEPLADVEDSLLIEARIATRAP